MLAVYLLTLVCVITYAFEIVFGLAGTTMMLMVMSYFFAPKTLVIYSILPQILVGAIGLVRSPRTVRLGVLGPMLAFAAVGAAFGLYLFYYFSSHAFAVLLACAIMVFGIYLVLRPAGLSISRPVGHVLDTMAGVSQGLFGISGPVAMTRLLGTFADKTVVRNYALAFFLAMNLFRGGGYILNDTITPEIRDMMLVSAPFLVIALWFANHLHFKVNEALFRNVVAWIILLGGLSLLFNALH